MPTRLVDQQGTQVTVGRRIGRRGGEGSAYEATSHPGFVVKIYHEPPSQDKAAKLWHLTQLGAASSDLLKFAAWPTQIVWKDGQKPCGFLMPYVKGKEIHQLFGPRERFIEFPSAGWDFLVHVARNCAAVFDSVHNLGVVIGDVNEGNLLVTGDGTVRLIDCDSYQVQNGSHLWTCDVGIPLWTPPELQGRNFRGLCRTANHDRFGLAALIFKLLFMGRHPYAGIPTRAGDFVLEKAIANYMFAFSPRSPALGVRPPPHCLSLDSFPPSYLEYFEHAFMRGSENGRPTAAQWAQAMDALLANLTKCGRDPSHKYPRSMRYCPWCEIAVANGPNFFISVTVVLSGGAGNTSDLWKRIVQIEEATLTTRRIEDVRFPKTAGTPLPPGVQEVRVQFVVGCILAAVAIVFIFSNMIILGITAALFASGLMSGGPRSGEFRAERERRKAAAAHENTTLHTLFQQLQSVPGDYHSEFTQRRAELRKAYERYARLDQERAREIQKLEQNKRDLQLRAFLDRQLIVMANIHGIGPGRAATLQAYGIESALDVSTNISVPGIGDTYTKRLVIWRNKCEAIFRFNPTAPIPQQELHQLNVRMTTLGNNLLFDLKQGPQALANLTGAVKSKVARIEAQINVGIRRCAQTTADVAMLAN